MKTSTKVLGAVSLGAASFFGWLLDPTNLATVNTLLHGHARLLSVLGAAITIWNLFHQPADKAPSGTLGEATVVSIKKP